MKNIGNKIDLFIISTFFISTLQSCLLFIGTKSKYTEPIADTYVQNGFAKATIINYAIDGCTFMVQLENGKKLEPINLQDEFKKDNFNVWIKYQHFKGNSICMAGEMITVTAIEKRPIP